MQTDEQFAGQQVKCPGCGGMLVVPLMAPGLGAGPQVFALRPHRGAAVLTLGILGIVVCWICGIIAWVMGHNDLREMAAGRMDRLGEGMTRAGKICGIIGTLIPVVILGIYLLIIVIAVLIVAVSQAS
jgi:uncharacterized membrane protein